MFTLMPVAAFAASPAVGAVAVNDVALDEFDQSITVKEGEKVVSPSKTILKKISAS